MRERDLRPIVDRWCFDQGMFTAHEMCVCASAMCDVVGLRFSQRVSRKRPQLEFIVAIELKLDDVSGVIYQARRNSHFAHQSYAAMPEERVSRMKPGTLQVFELNGVGLMSVSDTGVQIVVAAPTRAAIDERCFDRISRNGWRHCRDQFESHQKRATAVI